MSKPPCGLANSLLEPEFRDAAMQGVIAHLEILETPHDGATSRVYFVAARMQWSGEKLWYLTTRRDRDTPRKFRDISALLRLLRDIAPGAATLRFGVRLPPATDECVTPARAGHSTPARTTGSAGRA